ncbi:MAG: YchJ family protein [Marinifilaceae bacterium]
MINKDIHTKPCPCGSGDTFANCCAPILNGQKKALTAEALMQSRYTAFTLADTAYLMQSWHPDTCPLTDEQEIGRWARSVTWVKLEVLEAVDGEEADTWGSVTFKAFYREKRKLCCIHEESEFVHLNGKWVYVSGKHH